MHIKSIKVNNFRKFMKPVEISGLPHGLAIISGNNEEGKSTLLQAIQTALFEKHKLTGQAADAMKPMGQSVSPTVELDFIFDGSSYNLKKSFCQNEGACLEGAGEKFESDAAEEKLVDLLGFHRPKKGLTSQEHRGLWSLLWVSQGTAFNSVNPNEIARNSIANVLQQEVGDVLGGSTGQKLLDYFNQEKAKYWGANDRQVKELSASRKELDQLNSELQEINDKLKDYGDLQDKLETTVTERQRFMDQDIIAKMEEKLELAKKKKKELDRCQEGLKAVQHDQEISEFALEQSSEKWKTRHGLRESIEDSDKKVEELKKNFQEQSKSVEKINIELEVRRKDLENAENNEKECRKRVSLIEQRLKFIELEEKQKRLSSELKKAQDANTKKQEAWKQIGAILINKEDLVELNKLENTLTHAQATLAGAATEVSVNVSIGYEITGDYSKHESGYLATGSARINLDGVGFIGIQAGGKELDSIKSKIKRTRQKRDDKLAELGLENVKSAQEQFDKKQEQEGIVESMDNLIKAHAPGGIQQLQDELSQLNHKINSIPAFEDVINDVDPMSLEEELVNEKTAFKTAESFTQIARAELNSYQQIFYDANSKLIESKTLLETENSNLTRNKEKLKQERAKISDEKLLDNLKDAKTNKETADNAVIKAQQSLASLDPDDIELELQNTVNAVKNANDKKSKLDQAVNNLKIELRSKGQEGLTEKEQEVSRKVQEAERNHKTLEKRAKAIKLAAQALEEAASSAKELFLQPLTNHFEPYLSRLFPDSNLLLNENLELEMLDRNGHLEPFYQLSVGTREQIAVITRLAFADLLTEKGNQSPPIILDDALVYSDDDRFEKMKKIISRSAKNYQVIILTCRPTLYADLGVPEFRIS